MKIYRLLVLCVATVLLASTAFVTPALSERAAQPAPQAQAPDVAVQKGVESVESVAATYEYWTPERMAAAEPMELGMVEGEPGGVAPAEAQAALGGEPVFVPGYNAGEAPRGQISAQQAYAEAAGVPLPAIDPMSAVGTPWYPYPFPYTYSYMGSSWPTFYPMRTNGKMFFTQLGTNYVCSGTVITSGTGGNNDLIDTAGHCVHAANGSSTGWSINVLFCPAYWAGAGPWGCWASVNEWTHTDWYNSGDWRDDVGFVIAAASSNTGYGNIGTTIGTNGVAWNVSYLQDIWSFGYPAQSPYTGTTLVWTTSGSAEVDDPGGTGPYALGIGSNETGGSSGGAWSILQRLAIPGYVVSHNDYKYSSPSRPLAMYGPWYGTDYGAIWEEARQP
jgi:hypothetical protein